MTSNALALDNQLCFALYSASHAFKKVYRPLLAALDVTYPQYLVLLILWEKHDARVTDICVALGLDTGTLSPLLKRLERTGYIKRARSTDDERQVMIMLTPVGQSKREVAEAMLHDIAKAIGCTMQEAAALTGSIRDLKRRLSAAA